MQVVTYRWNDSPTLDLCPWCRGYFRGLSQTQYEQAAASCSCPFCEKPVVFDFWWNRDKEYVRIWPIMTSADTNYILSARSPDIVNDLFQNVVRRFRLLMNTACKVETLQLSLF